MLAIIGPVYREVEDFDRWVNPLRRDNPPVHVISHFNLNQEPISWNEQLPQRFHGPVSFQNGFGANLGHPLSPTNPSAKHTNLKKIIFAFSVNDATFSFLISLYFECVHSVVIFHFRVKNRPIRLTQCCTQFKPFGNKTFCFRNFHITELFWHMRMLISVNQNAERARTVREKERGRSLIALFYLSTSFFLYFFLLNFIRETFLCSLNLFSCAQPILIAWTSCLKLIISKLYSAEATTLNEKIHKLRIAKEKNIEFNFFRTLICIT